MGRYYIPPDNHFAAKHKLTLRELDILRLIAQGLPYKEIARTIHIAHSTTQNYGKTIIRKTGANNMIQAVVMFVLDEARQESNNVLEQS